MKYILPLFVAFSLLLNPSNTSACSALFVKKASMLLGKNFDWYNGEGMIIKNNRGIRKTAYGLDSENLATWTAKYGSFTFNQVGKEFPYGGVNEKGLAIEMLWYSDSYYEENGKPSLSELEWIQYQLDNYKTAAEVQYFLDSVSINPIHANLHYIVADRGGRSFVVDFVEGKAVVSNTKEEFQVLTNSNYLGSLKYYEKNKKQINHTSRSSIDRFCQLTSKAGSNRAQKIEGLFDILSESAEYGETYKTYWSVVYDLKSYHIYFKSSASQRRKMINLNSTDFSKNSPIYAVDINAHYIHFKRFTSAMNRQLLDGALDQANIKLNREMANKHMMRPSKKVMDDQYAQHHKDLKIEFTAKKVKGLLFYTLIQGEENYKSYTGVESAVTRVSRTSIKRIHYSLPRGNYALAAFHDLNSNKKMDKFLGIPREPSAFSNNKKTRFGPPDYDQVVFDSFLTPRLSISIK